MQRREFISASRRRGGRVAAHGARAAAGDAGGRVSQRRVGRRVRALVARVPPGPEEAGYVEGQNVAIEYRWAEGQYDRLPAMAADLVRRQVAVIARSTALRRSRQRRRQRPFPSSSQQASIRSQLGLVASLNRPGGNVTGRDQLERGGRAEAAGAAARARADGHHRRAARQSDQSQCRDPGERPAGGGPHARAAAPCPAMRAPSATSIRSSRPCANCGRRARDRHRCIFHQPERTARRAGDPPCGSRDLPILASSSQPAA